MAARGKATALRTLLWALFAVPLAGCDGDGSAIVFSLQSSHEHDCGAGFLVFAVAPAPLGEDADIWRMRADGSDLLRLTTDARHEFRPVWSSDGSRIAYLRDRGGDPGGDLCVMNQDGSGAVAILGFALLLPARIAWSPDEMRFAMTIPEDARESSFQLWIWDTADAEPRQVTFDASASSDDDAIVEYSWDFDGDGTFDLTGDAAAAEAPRSSYAAPGSYEARLRVRDTAGQTAETTRTVVVESDEGEVFTLTLVIANDGGSAVSDPAGIAWSFEGGTCSFPFPAGASVDIVATPYEGNGVEGWDGCDGVSIGDRRTCRVTMNGDRTVTLTFAIEE